MNPNLSQIYSIGRYLNEEFAERKKKSSGQNVFLKLCIQFYITLNIFQLQAVKSQPKNQSKKIETN